jgi:FkbM family methyltransferase
MAMAFGYEHMKIINLMLARGMNKPFIRRPWDAITRLPIIGSSLHSIARRLLPPQQRVWVRVKYQELPGERFWISAEPRYESGHLLGTHDPTVQGVLVSHLKPGNCFYDIGAHVGFFSMLAAGLVGEKGFIVALEPDRRNVALLRETLARNSLGLITDVVNQAAWSHAGNVNLLSANPGPHSNTGMSKVVSGNLSDSYEVSCTTLDKLSKTHPAPTLIKIDVEGAESEVLKGAEELFTHSRPHLICEVHDPGNASFVESWLNNKNYEHRWLDIGGDFHRQLLAAPK